LTFPVIIAKNNPFEKEKMNGVHIFILIDVIENKEKDVGLYQRPAFDLW